LVIGKRILILGAGFGGLAAANLLRKNLSADHRIILIDRKQSFIMGFVNLWIVYGTRRLEDSQTDLNILTQRGIEFIKDEIIKIDTQINTVTTKLQGELGYDYLIIALGAELAPEKINGFVENRGFNLYDVKQTPKLHEKLLSLKSGRIAISIMGIPYKCPPAPYEASLLINDMLIKNGTRNSIEIDLYVPTPMALPVAGQKISQAVVDLINYDHINFYPSYKIKSIREKELEFENGSKRNYNVLVGIPPHKVPDVIKNSGLINGEEQLGGGGGEERWINVDRHTLRTVYKNVFAIGDVTEIRITQTTAIPKAGIFAEGEAKVVAQQIIDDITNKSNNTKFDGKGFCFMEIGNKKAGYIDADFYNEAGPTTRLEPPSEESYQKKWDFESSKIKEWLL
jgi:sulfide:quinone oxidoreductase